MDTDAKYRPDFSPQGDGESALALLFADGRLLLKNTGGARRLPFAGEMGSLAEAAGEPVYIGRYKERDCYAMQADKLPALPEGMELAELRQTAALTGDEDLFMLAGTASHLLYWRGLNRYCGRCGHETQDKADERARLCPACGNVIYPRISPATITAVLRGDEILLAHNRGFRGDIYSLIAGFVTPGENLEQCLRREIMEEVGVSVKNIRYFGSQPWPFPDSLMMAFVAEHEGGEIKVDELEISKAAWFRPDDLPAIPGTESIAGKLIRWYRDTYAPSVRHK